MTKKDLEKMTVTDLREEALKYKDQIDSAINSMKKAELIQALIEILEIKEEPEKVVEKKIKKKDKVVSKESLKKEMMAFKKEKEEALKGKDKIKVKLLRRKIKILKRKIRSFAQVAEVAEVA